MVIFDYVNKFVLHDIDIHIPRGVTVGIIGASGAGKTTFLKLVSGLLKPELGRVHTLRQNPVDNKSKIAKRISVLFSDIPVYEDNLTIMDHLDEIKIMYGMNKVEFETCLMKISHELNFSELLHSKPKSLSLGQKRRAELGLTLLRDADLYIFDEPCIGLDQNGKAAFYKLIEDKKKQGKTILVSSHDMEDISRIADRVLLLDKGALAFYGSKEELYKSMAPMEESYIEFEGTIPDISDLEIERYILEHDKLTIQYNSNHVSSKEVLERICLHSRVKSVIVRRAKLGDTIKQLNGEVKKSELY